MNSQVKAENTGIHTDCKIASDFEVLRRSPVFAGADTEVIKLFAYLVERKKYMPGDNIITQGQAAENAFLLISGTAEVSTLHRNQQIILQKLHHCTFFGELALLARFKWFFQARSLTECEAISISRESFHKVLEKFPQKRDIIIEKIIQLRVARLIDQTTFMLDKLPDSLLLELGNSTANISI